MRNKEVIKELKTILREQYDNEYVYANRILSLTKEEYDYILNHNENDDINTNIILDIKNKIDVKAIKYVNRANNTLNKVICGEIGTALIYGIAEVTKQDDLYFIKKAVEKLSKYPKIDYSTKTYYELLSLGFYPNSFKREDEKIAIMTPMHLYLCKSGIQIYNWLGKRYETKNKNTDNDNRGNQTAYGFRFEDTIK